MTLSNDLGDSFITNLNYNLESFELSLNGLTINDGNNNILALIFCSFCE